MKLKPISVAGGREPSAVNCDLFQVVLAEAEDPGKLDALGQRHIAACARCRKVLKQLQAITVEAKTLAHAEPPPAMWAQIRRQLEREGVIAPPDEPSKNNGSGVPAAEPPPWRRFPVFPGRR